MKKSVVMHTKANFDVDNAVKGLLDCAHNIVFENDGVVCGLLVFKRYTIGDEKPGVWINVYRLS